MKTTSFSPTPTLVPKIKGRSSLNSADRLKHAHVYTSIGHDDGRDYGYSEDYPSVPTYELFGLFPAEDHVTATSGDVLSHQGVTTDGTSFYTSDSAALYKWSAIGATPTADGTNPSNLTPFAALESETSLSGFNHFGGIQYAEIGGTGYIVTCPVRDPGGNPGGIALYGTDLTYVAGSFSDFSASGYRISAVAVDNSKNELYFAEFSASEITDIYVCKLSDAVAGDLTVERYISLGYPVYNVQGIYKKGEELYVEHNNLGETSIVVFNESGAPVKCYRAFAGGPEDIDLSQPDTLYFLKSSAVGQGNIMTIDLAGAEVISEMPSGRVLNNPVANTPNMAYQSLKSDAVGDTGTRVIRLKTLAANSLTMVGQSCGTNNDTWNIEIIVASGQIRARFYLDGGGASIVTSTTSNDLPIGEEHSLAITWNRITASEIDIKMYLDGVLADSATETDSAKWTEFKSMAIGRGWRYSRSAYMEVFHDYVFDSVLDGDTLLAIHNDPYSVFEVQ